ncbi:hypothetical protein A3G67_01930 [Candidatus Roizmanbacteria bacterium RIFCSPLOWO2_12_FULL_40_12]|uniref:Uncharacterized protein n=1 Tax=Candidatus Roizmanbacteria bacterium RIFCSPLOWO2_01_FULL_40_42 TaxID=1802066 RepID=A0A1F7J3I9_9BACT|nr:MAG: hypothetical protein A2779_01050 [Candidatus Roizmanbacteria bacterium RIFCSPHIGHO2_01_FULL_40_98]OGK28954.1 MAG: hypothetical protein A3C31_01690 [Candidatus Roizmanbacteria bacterium RIFCSPHIGHO2_02_FULL_40_53]OGK29580.1 MAG: hypothetical protein A2W49_03850 [Candidatus Roizmanbacteria bacterium RIFCSPHIGHO2_12_41_18]OGK37241.1 MAG: hypothetical protein A3E69_03990 [Candidatus Roizmanbacteria bacterium RIFCSPHIGHO2_12_FULL_40_130]OGK50183.1 MAG: hypothetical protein A3B50_00145 [Candi
MPGKRGPEFWKDKANWNLDNSSVIAAHFGYKEDELFREALGVFSATMVSKATITMFLELSGEAHFKNFRPPLTRVNT